MNLIESYLEYVRPLRGSIRYNRWSILTTISAFLERRCWIERGRLGVLFPNLYTLLVGAPATGKTTAADFSVALFREVHPTGRKPPHLSPTKITQAALYKELKDSERTIQFANRNPLRMSPVFIYAPELAINMVDFGGGTLTNELIDFFDSKGLHSYQDKRTVAEGNLRLHNPSVTLLGCTTEGFLHAAAQDKLITSGLSARIVFCVEPSFVEKEREIIAFDPDLHNQLVKCCDAIYAMKGPFISEPHTHEAFVKIAKAADHQCYVAQTEFLQNYFGRKPDHTLKIAMCLAASEGTLRIRPEFISQAVTWLEELEPDMQKAFGVRAISGDVDLFQQLLYMIPLEPEWMTRSELIRRFFSLGKIFTLNKNAEDTVRSLRESEFVRVQHLGNQEVYTRTKESLK